MTLNKQLINLIGLVLTVAVLVAGVALGAMPMWSQAQATDASTRTVAQTNSVYQAQVDALSAAEDRIEEIDAHVATLRASITTTPQLDDVFEIVGNAATVNELTLESVKIGEPESYAPRVGGADTSATAPAEAATSADGAATPAPAADAAASSQQQLVVTITVPVPDANAATAFIDALRGAPRLLLPIDSTLADGKLTVQALTFIRTED